MRTIKFRGKRIDTKEWIFGYLLYIEGKPFIFPFGAAIRHAAHWGENGSFGILGSGDEDDIVGIDQKRISGLWLSEVIPESVGQFTAFKISNQDIFEDDVLESISLIGHKPIQGKVVFNDQRGRWEVEEIHSEYTEREILSEILKPPYQTKLIGSIHDQPVTK